MAEHHDVLLAPQVEMAERHLFVDELRQLAERGALVGRGFEIEGTADVKQT